MSNCLIFALALWWRRIGNGQQCRIRWRRSHWGNFPHFLYSEQRRGARRLISYKPIHPKPQSRPPLRFQGRVAWGDKPPNTQGRTTRKGS